ncbi:MAG: hypothetical protein ACLFPF_01575 [Halanaerobiales bacterium]
MISNIVAADSPHKFAFFHEEPEKYYDLLIGKVIGNAHAYGGLVEIEAENTRILFGDGVRIRFHDKDEKRPKKHQLFIEYDDGTALSGSVQMYGGLWCFKEGSNDNPYYLIAKEKPSPLSDEFDSSYFEELIFR